MRSWLLSRITFIVVAVGYIDSVLNLVTSNGKFSLILITSLSFTLLKLFTIIRPEERSLKLKWNWIDILTTILFFVRVKDNFKISISYNGILSNNLPIELKNIIIYIFFAVIIFSIINEIMVGRGIGLQQLIKILVFNIKYTCLYFGLRHDSTLLKKILTERVNLTEPEYFLLQKSATWRKEQAVKEFPVILRSDAMDSTVQKNWLYNNSLVQGEKIELQKTKNEANGVSYDISIDLTDSHLAITNNTGKKYLRYSGNSESQVSSQEENLMKKDNIAAHNFLISGLTNDIQSQSIRMDQNCIYRWGSGGAIPIIRWKGNKWIAFVYRDIYPKGWNLPLGSSENELEKGRPGITAIRELLEEIIVTEKELNEYQDGKTVIYSSRRELYHPLLNSISTETNYQAGKRKFYKQQEGIISQTCSFRFNAHNDRRDTIDCRNCNTSLTISVRDNNWIDLIKNNITTNCLVTINSYEQAIECIKPVTFNLDKENELRMGEIDYITEQWINNPVILISYDKLQALFKNKVEYNTVDTEYGEGLLIDGILTQPENYHIFGLNLLDRKKHLEYLESRIKLFDSPIKKHFHKIEYRRLSAQRSYLNKFISENGQYFTNQNTINSDNKPNNPGFYLCPASWKSLSYFFSGNYDTDI